MRSLLLLCAVILSGLSSFATNISGGIYSNTTWTLANSPYIVTGNIVVFENVLLEIEPGVQILIDGNYLIEVRGRMKAIGTSADPINIKPNTVTTSNNYWKGIKFVGTTMQNNSQGYFEYCNISNAMYCFDLDIAYQGPYIFRNSVFTHNYQVNNDGGAYGTYFEDCIMKHNTQAIDYMQFGGHVVNCVFDSNSSCIQGVDSVVNCIFTNNTNIGVYSGGNILNCEFYHNHIAVAVPSGPHKITGNKIKDNEIGLHVYTWASNDFTNNEICGNTVYNVEMDDNHNADMSNSCWCSIDSAYIRSTIFDGYVDINQGLVDFVPFNSGCFPLFVQGPSVPKLDIWPNPVVTGQFTIKSATELSDISLYDLTGKKVAIEVKAAGSYIYNIRVPLASSGVYFASTTGLASRERIVSKVIFE